MANSKTSDRYKPSGIIHLPKSQQAKAESLLQEIWMSATREDAYKAFDEFIEEYGAK